MRSLGMSAALRCRDEFRPETWNLLGQCPKWGIFGLREFFTHLHLKWVHEIFDWLGGESINNET